MKRKLLNLSLIICVIVCIFAIPQIISAETKSNYTYTVSGSDATIIEFPTDVGGEVVIPDTIGNYTVTTIASNAFKDCNLITIF